MKNIMIIDAANNCAYDVFAASDDDFLLFFPAERQDIAFISEVLPSARKKGLADHRKAVQAALTRLWEHPVDKRTMIGLHGTLFYQLDFKKRYYPTRRSDEMVNPFTAKLM